MSSVCVMSLYLPRAVSSVCLMFLCLPGLCPVFDVSLSPQAVSSVCMICLPGLCPVSVRCLSVSQGCVQYSQCLCHCDGEWMCPERFSHNICEHPQSRVPNVEGECGSCLVDSRVVRGNTYFDMVSECFR